MSRVFWCTGLIVGLIASIGPTFAADAISIPAYDPPVGKEIVFQVELATTVEMRGADPLEPRTARGDFLDRLTVLERIPSGFRMLCQFNTVRSPDAPGPESDYSVNQTFRDAIAFYGVDGLDVDTDASGTPTAVFGAELILENMQKRLDQARPDDTARNARVVEKLKRDLAANPVFLVNVLVPAARLIASGQRDQARSALTVGTTESFDQVLHFGGVATPSTMKRTLASVDPSAHAATFTWVLDVDQSAYTRGVKDELDSEFDALRRKLGEIPQERMAELTSAEIAYSGEMRISLDDGATVFAEEIVQTRIGPIHTKVVSRVTQQ